MLYLVDYENTGSHGLCGCECLDQEDTVVVFDGEDQEDMITKLKASLPETKSQIIYKGVSTGRKNALDFQLSSYLGALICASKENSFCIVSKDRGYEVLEQFWGMQADICFAESISKQKGLVMEDSLNEIYGKETTETIIHIMDITESKSAFHGQLCHVFGSETGKDIYNKVKLYACC